MKIIDLSAGKRAIWFDKSYRDAVYVDVRPQVLPDVVADATALPAEIGTNYDLVVFDPPHKNSGASGNMSVRSYGHWTAEQITGILTGTARESHRIAKRDGLMALKWNDHTRKLSSVLDLINPWWEPLFGHGAAPQQRSRSTTHWIMLRKRESCDVGWEINTVERLSMSPETADKVLSALKRMNDLHGVMMAQINHKMSNYDARCLKEMNEAPIEAERAIIAAQRNETETQS